MEDTECGVGDLVVRATGNGPAVANSIDICIDEEDDVFNKLAVVKTGATRDKKLVGAKKLDSYVYDLFIMADLLYYR